MLVGSGVSTDAGIPTGWGAVADLIGRAAAASDPDNPEAAGQAVVDPDAWWAEHGDGQPLGYSNLLSALAPTPAARRGLLAGFFEPTSADVEAGHKAPSDAHRAIAEMAKRGLVRVILTANFDRLIERALEDAGVSPHVASRSDARPGLALSCAITRIEGSGTPIRLIISSLVLADQSTNTSRLRIGAVRSITRSGS